MADEEEIVVEIEKDEIAVEKTAAEQPDPVAELKAQHEALKAETEKAQAAQETERQRANQESQRRAAAERDAETARGEVAESRLGTVEQGLLAAQVALDAASVEHDAALEAGEFKKATEAQKKMMKAVFDIGRLEESKANLEADKAGPAERKEQPRQSPADPVEAFLARCEPGTAAWLREHPDDAKVLALDYNSPRAKKLAAADNDAQSEGLKPGSKEYFAHVEKFLGMVKPNGNGGMTTKQQPARRSASVAPVSASSGGVSGGGAEVRLTRGEAQAATDGTLQWNYDDPSPQKRFKKGDPIGIQEMARRKKAMTEQGLYDKTYVEQ